MKNLDFTSLSIIMQGLPPAALTSPVARVGAQNTRDDTQGPENSKLRRDLEAIMQRNAQAEQEKAELQSKLDEQRGEQDALQEKLEDTENRLRDASQELEGKKSTERVMHNKIGKANNVLLSKMLEHQEAIAAHYVSLSEKLGLPIVKKDEKGSLSANWEDESEAQAFLGKFSDDTTYASLPSFRDVCEIYIGLTF